MPCLRLLVESNLTSGTDMLSLCNILMESHKEMCVFETEKT